ncbi:MAG: SPFH domain-containing protein [Ardenticatenaceae bacterium]|nr:SPFH domain-containing protein [Ardenticatenaceae bacterium]
MAQQGFSKVKEVVSSWGQVRQFLRSGDQGHLVPVVIPKDRRGYAVLFWIALSLFSLASAVMAIIADGLPWFSPLGFLGFLGFAFMAFIALIRSMIVEVEEGTAGILSSWGEITDVLPPGRKYIWRPWEKVEYIVDTSTEIPYTAPVLSSPTQENVPLKSIEFFLKFRIVNPILFVRRIGASNFDIVLSSAVQDAIRQRTRHVETAKAYDLRGSDVGDMQRLLNETMERYGVRITGANIPDVQLPEQYQNNLATQERIAKELVAYEKEWDLMRKRRKDALELEIEQAKKVRDAKLVSVREAINKARQDVALMLQEKETEAQKIKLEIETHGKAELKAAENQAKALQRLGEAYKDNQAVLRYELEIQRLDVAKDLMQQAPRPVVVNTGRQGGTDSALSTLLLAQILPQTLNQAASNSGARQSHDHDGAENGQQNLRSMMDTLMGEVEKRTKKK